MKSNSTHKTTGDNVQSRVLSPENGVSSVRILLVEDHVIVRQGLRLLLENETSYSVVGEAANRDEALAQAAQTQPHVILLDLRLGEENSSDWIQDLLEAAPHTRILILTAETNPIQHSRAVSRGASGLVLKEQASTILCEAIASVLRDEIWIDPAMMTKVLAEMRKEESTAKREDLKIASLSAREREIIALVGQGLKNREIAERLFLAETTVRHHLTSIFTKLDVTDRLDLVIYAYRHGLIALH